jgi:DNA-binding response OmpR family regulator
MSTVGGTESVESLTGHQVVEQEAPTEWTRQDAAMPVFVSQLRRKIEPDPAHPSLIVTEPGVGYRWAQPPAG